MDALIDLALIWAGVLVAVYLAKRTRLTPALYFLAVGAVFVNLGILPEEPHEFIRGFAEIGIVLIMFAIGFEEQVQHFVGSMKRSWGIALFGAIGPFAAAYAVTWYFWQDFSISLMSGLAMTATAVSLTMVALRSEGLIASKAATRIMTSAVLDDIGVLSLVAILIPIAASGTMPTVFDLFVTILKAMVFFAVVTMLGVWVFPQSERPWLKKLSSAGWPGLRTVLAFDEGQYATLILLLLALSIGLLAHTFGFHPAVGAYMAGLILREEYFSYERQTNAYVEVKGLIDNVAFAWIGPVFFVVLGTKLVFDWDMFVALIPETALLTTSLLVVQIASAAIAARYTGGMLFAGSVLVGLGMLGRAELAFVVMDIAYVQNRILSDDAFYVLMFSAFCLNVAVPILIRWWKPYYVAEVARE